MGVGIKAGPQVRMSLIPKLVMFASNINMLYF